jgi:hypothetical protein
MAHNGKEKLIGFLDRRVFQPILQAKPDDRSEGERDKLQRVQRATKDALQRYRSYDSAQKVYQMYRDDLTSGPAESVTRDLRALGLPTLADARDEFERLADEVGAKG